MAAYDSPGYGDRTPAGRVMENTGMGGSPASFPVPDVTGTTAQSALVTPYGSGYQNGDRVAVTPSDALVAPQADLYTGADANPLSGIAGGYAGGTGIGGGHVRGPGAS